MIPMPTRMKEIAFAGSHASGIAALEATQHRPAEVPADARSELRKRRKPQQQHDHRAHAGQPPPSAGPGQQREAADHQSDGHAVVHRGKQRMQLRQRLVVREPRGDDCETQGGRPRARPPPAGAAGSTQNRGRRRQVGVTCLETEPGLAWRGRSRAFSHRNRPLRRRGRDSRRRCVSSCPTPASHRSSSGSFPKDARAS